MWGRGARGGEAEGTSIDIFFFKRWFKSIFPIDNSPAKTHKYLGKNNP